MTDSRPSHTLRQFLRRSTAGLHDRLDRAMTGFDLDSGTGYARFLEVQLLARAPIEAWAAANCPPDLRPPETAALLRADLAALGMAPPPAEAPFALPAGGDPLGLAWAIAGSHLGNRAILAGLQRAGAADRPQAFLTDPRMSEFWRALRPGLEVGAAAEREQACLLAAEAVFALFLAAATRAECRHVA